MSSSTALEQASLAVHDLLAPEEFLLRKAILKLLEVKDSDVRILDVEQCRDAVDKGLHSGGAFSAAIPLTTLFYGGFINVDVVDPTRPGPDLFTFSKGHAVAKQAAIFGDPGYFDWGRLKRSGSFHGTLKRNP